MFDTWFNKKTGKYERYRVSDYYYTTTAAEWEAYVGDDGCTYSAAEWEAYEKERKEKKAARK